MGRTFIACVRTTFRGFHHVGKLDLLCNPPQWDAPSLPVCVPHLGIPRGGQIGHPSKWDAPSLPVCVPHLGDSTTWANWTSLKMGRTLIPWPACTIMRDRVQWRLVTKSLVISRHGCGSHLFLQGANFTGCKLYRVQTLQGANFTGYEVYTI
jgi:hypothetical protein